MGGLFGADEADEVGNVRGRRAGAEDVFGLGSWKKDILVVDG